jgi:hypothetical protein
MLLTTVVWRLVFFEGYFATEEKEEKREIREKQKKEKGRSEELKSEYPITNTEYRMMK